MKKVFMQLNSVQESKQHLKLFMKKKTVSTFRRLQDCILIYTYSLSEKKKRFLRGKCKHVTSTGKNIVLHIISKYFSVILLTKFPVQTSKCVNIQLGILE
jgi:hypothetical protein